jgi:hypothetical protein
MDQLGGGVADFTDVQKVGLRIIFWADAHGRAAEDSQLSKTLCLFENLNDASSLRVHPGECNDVGPSQIAILQWLDVFIDDAEFEATRLN